MRPLFPAFPMNLNPLRRRFLVLVYLGVCPGLTADISAESAVEEASLLEAASSLDMNEMSPEEAALFALLFPELLEPSGSISNPTNPDPAVHSLTRSVATTPAAWSFFSEARISQGFAGNVLQSAELPFDSPFAEFVLDLSGQRQEFWKGLSLDFFYSGSYLRYFRQMTVPDEHFNMLFTQVQNDWGGAATGVSFLGFYLSQLMEDPFLETSGATSTQLGHVEIAPFLEVSHASHLLRLTFKGEREVYDDSELNFSVAGLSGSWETSLAGGQWTSSIGYSFRDYDSREARSSSALPLSETTLTVHRFDFENEWEKRFQALGSHRLQVSLRLRREQETEGSYDDLWQVQARLAHRFRRGSFELENKISFQHTLYLGRFTGEDDEERYRNSLTYNPALSWDFADAYTLGLQGEFRFMRGNDPLDSYNSQAVRLSLSYRF